MYISKAGAAHKQTRLCPFVIILRSWTYCIYIVDLTSLAHCSICYAQFNFFIGPGPKTLFPGDLYLIIVDLRGAEGNTRSMFTDAIKNEQRRIQRLIELSLDEKLDDDKRGKLYLMKQKDKYYAYERWRGNGEPEKKVYLGSLDSDPVRELFAIKYKEQKLARLQYDQELLDKIEQKYRPYDWNSIVYDMPKPYRMAAKGDIYNQRYEEIRAWAEADYPKNTYPFPDTEIYAKDGTRLRSKGECIWYNLLQERGVLFRYDCEIEFIDKQGETRKLCPDFLIMCLDGTMIIIEHLGRMGDVGYAIRFGESSYWYFQSGFVLGKNYFVTSDEPNYGTDSQVIARLVEKIEAMFFGF